MGQTLDNGIYLPSEGERNCYDGLASNWTTLDAVVGGYNAHVANENIHITSEERSKWNNGVTQAYVLRYANTSLTALGTVAFSALDNTDNIKIGDKVLDSEGKLFALTAVDTESSTATLSALLIDLSKDSDLSNYYTKPETDTLLSYKATDSNVVHKSGNETVAGYKVFENICLSNSIKAINLENQTIDLNNCYSSFGLPQSGNISFYFCNTNDGTANISNLPEQRSFFLISQSIRILSAGSVLYLKQTLVNSNGKTFVRYCNNSVWGSWQDVTNLVTTDTDQTISGNKTFSSINGVEPSSLSLPSGNTNDYIDISSYITDLNGANLYTPPANGYLTFTFPNGSQVQIYPTSGGGVSSKWASGGSAGIIRGFVPVLKNSVIRIVVNAKTMESFYFIPCQGNV